MVALSELRSVLVKVHLYLYQPHRALEFVHAFLECVLSGEEDLVVCANIAYEKSLKKYHGWIVRGIFKVSPYYRESYHPCS